MARHGGAARALVGRGAGGPSIGRGVCSGCRCAGSLSASASWCEPARRSGCGSSEGPGTGAMMRRDCLRSSPAVNGRITIRVMTMKSGGERGWSLSGTRSLASASPQAAAALSSQNQARILQGRTQSLHAQLLPHFSTRPHPVLSPLRTAQLVDSGSPSRRAASRCGLPPSPPPPHRWAGACALIMMRMSG